MDKLLVLAIFLMAYLIIIFKRRFYLAAVWAAVILLFGLRLISPKDAMDSVNLNVLGIFVGTSILSTLFVFSGVPSYLASRMVSRARNVGLALLSVCILAGFISTFVENVVTIMIVAPVAFEVAKRLNVSPVRFLIGITVASNLQGCATMIGDSPSIILAGFAKMNFMDFIWMRSRPGIFFAVELGAVASFYVLYRVFKRHRQPTVKIETEAVKSWIPTCFFIMMLSALIISSFAAERSYYIAAYICLSFGLAGLLWHIIKHTEKLALLKDFDWKTFIFLIGIFILVGSLNKSGVIKDIAEKISSISAEKPFAAYTLIVWVSVILSAFVDNIPYTMTMLPVANMVAQNLGVSSYPYLFGLLIGTCLGGNITPIGATANVVTCGMLRKRGYSVSFGEFIKIGLPFTLAAVGIAYIFIWLVWAR